MSGYPQGGGGNSYGNYGGSPPPTAQPYNYGGAPPQPQPQTAQPYNYGGAPQTSQSYNPTATPYGAQPQPAPYGEKPHKNKYDTAPPQTSQSYNPTATPYGAQPPPAPYGEKPHNNKYDTAPSAAGGYGSSPTYPPSAPYGSPFATLVPSAFPPGTDPSVVTCFQMADQDGSGFIDDHELQGVLSSYNQKFSLRTVHLLMFHFTNTNTKKIGPKEFIAVFYSLQNWRSIFERFDRDRSGKIDSSELREALLSLGFAVSPVILDLLVSKFDKSGGRNKAIEYDNFIECCLTVKGLTEKFKEKDVNYSGSATFTYEAFMLTVLPFLVA